MKAAPELAWSLDDDDDAMPIEPQSWRSAWGVAAILLACAGVTAFVIGIVGWVSFREADDAAPPTTAPTIPASALPAITPKPTPLAAPPKPPVTVTVTPKPTTVTVEASPQAHPAPKLANPALTPNNTDERFLAALRRAQITIDNPAKALFGARWVCGQFANGFSAPDIAVSVKGSNPALTDLGAQDFIADSARFYCPEYSGN